MRKLNQWFLITGAIMDAPETPELAIKSGMTYSEIEDVLGTMMHILGDTEEPIEMFELIKTDSMEWSVIRRIFQYYDKRDVIDDIEDWAYSY